MSTAGKTILVSNDDGVNAPGLKYLVETIAHLGKIVVVAPAQPQSGMSSAITVDSPLHIKQCESIAGTEVYSVSGTPVDCIKLGLHAVMKGRKPDLVLSGINHGSNSGNSVNYSGTMGAVIEACMVGVPAIGFSLLHHSWAADFSQCGAFVEKITKSVVANGLQKDVCLNVNIPAKCTPKGIKICRASQGHWTEEYTEYTDPHGRPFYWLTGHFVDDNPNDPMTDNYWLDRQWVTIVPVRPDQTYTPAIDELRKFF